MTVETPGTVSLTSHRFIRPGYVDQLKEAVNVLAGDIAANDADTLTYADPFPNDPGSTAGLFTSVQFLTQVAGFALGQPREAL